MTKQEHELIAEAMKTVAVVGELVRERDALKQRNEQLEAANAVLLDCLAATRRQT